MSDDQAQPVTPREAGGKAAFDVFWKGGKDWGKCDQRFKEFWCEIAAKACAAIETAAGKAAVREQG